MNLKFCRDVRKHPVALMALLASSVTTALASGATWYVVALGKTPFDVRELNNHITTLERDVAKVQAEVSGEAIRDAADRRDIEIIKNQVTSMERKVEQIYDVILNKYRRS